MTGRFSHLDFDDAPEPARPKLARKPPPLMGPTWSDLDRQRAAGELSRQQPLPKPSRYELNTGRGTFSWVSPPDLSIAPDTSSLMAIPITANQIEYDVSWRSELVDPFAQFGEFVVRLGVRPSVPFSAPWDYQQVRCNQEVLGALRGEVPVLQRTFAPKRSIVVALDPRAKASDYIRTYIEIEAA